MLKALISETADEGSSASLARVHRLVARATECKTNKEDWVRVSKVKHAMQ